MMNENNIKVSEQCQRTQPQRNCKIIEEFQGNQEIESDSTDEEELTDFIDNAVETTLSREKFSSPCASKSYLENSHSNPTDSNEDKLSCFKIMKIWKIILIAT